MSLQRHVILVLPLCALSLVACGSSDPSSSATTTTVAPPATTTTSSTTTTSTTTTTTTTVYTGPPTLAPGEELPTPQAIPPDNVAEPEVVIGEIIIPALMMSQTLYQGVTLPTLDKGVGWWPGTALPGHAGNVVLGGHRVSHKKPFRYIDRLVPGDEIYLTTPEGTFVYAVRETQIVTPQDVWIIDQTPAATLTMFACHPPHSTRQRIVVISDYVRTEPAVTA